MAISTRVSRGKLQFNPAGSENSVACFEFIAAVVRPARPDYLARVLAERAEAVEPVVAAPRLALA